jgi:hypothetical protein
VDTRWPELPYEQWAETRDTLHLWTQVIGKVKLALTPFLNEWWNVAFSLTCRGMTTPSERPDPVPFEQDTADRAYDGAAARRWWLAMLSVGRVMDRFRTPFGAKSSPVLFYWGGFDLNHTRFSGRPAPARPGAGVIQAFGEDQENFAIGFWPGNSASPHAVLYAYLSPAPAGVETIQPDPPQARWVPGAGEFVLPWDELLAAADPDVAALEFFTSTYARTTSLAGWDRSALELLRVPEKEAS